jgi:transcriptional regulator with XRE-family HTH domain
MIINMKTLAQFIQKKRDDIGLSPKGLAMVTNLPLETIEDIESGKDLFLSVTVRQNLAKVLKCAPEEIKKYEKDFNNHIVSDQVIESLKELILNEAGGLKCPVCGAPLVTRIQKLYDLEDNLMLHPKAHCTKCSFQIHS